jgi:tetratricopeptide (TPR) repeat protein
MMTASPSACSDEIGVCAGPESSDGRAPTEALGQPAPERTAVASSDAVDRDLKAAEVFEMAVLLHAEGDFRGAEPLYLSALERQPDHADANHNFGVLLIQQERLPDSLSYLKAACDLTPDRADYRAVYEEALLLAGEPEKASNPISGEPLDSRSTAANPVALKCAYDEVILFCPQVVTGGPEAMHQLAYTINALGGNAKIAYYGAISRTSLANDQVECSYQPDPNLVEAYAAYQPVVLSRASLKPRTLVIFPEVLAEVARKMTACPRAIWWLSVDNAVVSNPKLTDKQTAREILDEPQLIHLYQSEYARHFLQHHVGLRNLFPLFDFINRDYIEEGESSAREARRHVAIFPRKGGPLAAQFVASAQGIDFRLLQNMSRAEVRAALRECAIYIDFGHHPGKDRVPREAAASGAVVFLHEGGRCAFRGSSTGSPLSVQHR